jgi:hypothetical protein
MAPEAIFDLAARSASGMKARRVKTRRWPGFQRSRQPGPDRETPFPLHLLRRAFARITLEGSVLVSLIGRLRFFADDASKYRQHNSE